MFGSFEKKVRRKIENGKSDSVIKLLNDKDKSVRITTMREIAKSRRHNYCMSLLSCMSDRDPEVRAICAQCLADLGSDTARTYLIRMLDEEKEETVLAAMKAAIRTLRELNKDNNQ